MLTGTALGEAIGEAIRLKGVPKTTVADHFGIKGPSVYAWINHGRISKRHLTELVAYFSDVVGPEHWGMSSQSARLDVDRLASLIETVEAAAILAEKRVGLPASPRMKARLITDLYCESGGEDLTARKVAMALAKILRNEEAHDEPTTSGPTGRHHR